MGIRQRKLAPSMASFGNRLNKVDDENCVNPPSPADDCDAAVKRGDVVGLFNKIRGGQRQLINHKDEFAKLHRLIESKMQDDLDGSIEMVLNHGCALTAYLLMRMRFLVHFQLDTADFLDPKSAVPIYDRVMHVQQNIERMEQHLLSVQQQRAATKRLQELARSKRLENDRVQPEEKPKGKTHKDPKPPETAKRNGTNGSKPPINGAAGGKLHTKRF